MLRIGCLAAPVRRMRRPFCEWVEVESYEPEPPCTMIRECQAAHEIACHDWFKDIFINGKPYMLALVGRPSLHGNYACMVYWTKGALRRTCRQTLGKTSFSPFSV